MLGQRSVHLPDDLFEVVVQRLPAREDRDPEAPLFPVGSADRLRMAIARACRDAGVPSSRRMTCGTGASRFCTPQGVSWAEIGARVGQRNLSTTADIYTHVLMDYREVDRASLLERVRAVQTPVQTSSAGNGVVAGTF